MNEQNQKMHAASETPEERLQKQNADSRQSSASGNSVMPSNDVELNESDMQILRRRRPNSSIARASSAAANPKNPNPQPRVTVQHNAVPSASVRHAGAASSPSAKGKTSAVSQAAHHREPRVTVQQTANRSHSPVPSEKAPAHTAPSKAERASAVQPSQKAMYATSTARTQPSRSKVTEKASGTVKASDQASMNTRVLPSVSSTASSHADQTRQFSISRRNPSGDRTVKIPRNTTAHPASPDDRTRSIAKVKNIVPTARKRISPKQDSADYDYDEDTKTGSAVSSVLKAVIYITFVLVTSAVLSYLGITVCNDVFAFVKADTEQTVTIPENATVEEISTILKDADVIRYPFIFRLYAQVRHDNGVFAAGEYTVSANTGYDDLLAVFKPAVEQRKEVQITIPEGYTTDQIIDLFVANGIGTREGFIDVIQNYDYDFWFIDELEENLHPGRIYRLEGYLFPDTYRFYSDSDEKTVIYKLLLRFDELYSDEFRARATELGYTTDQIITLASMIQMEAKYTSEYGAISSVFHNRLNHPNGETQGRLESDATIQYVLEERHTDLTQEDLELDSPYNTYKIAGLPAGPISNPCYAAITYALSPSETDYYYFVAQKNGYSLFAKTYAEHIQNKIKALS